jgi:hypothetical protein
MLFVKRAALVLFCFVLPLGTSNAQTQKHSSNTLRVHPINSRYFTDSSGKPIYLVGAHTWFTFQDGGLSDPPAILDFNAYLDTLEQYNHNFTKLWAWEQARWQNYIPKGEWFTSPMPFIRSGPGLALDGKPKYDLSKFNAQYFDRLRQRALAAQKRGVYVSVMLFQGWSLGEKNVDYAKEANPWRGHPFNAANNINGLDGDINKDGRGFEIHTLKNFRILSYQKAYVRKVIETLNDLDNVIYEISNESEPEATAWQYEMIRFVKTIERLKPKQHPVGMTSEFIHNVSNLANSKADWISPGLDQPYMSDPPVANGKKVVLVDTDHLWGIGGDANWVWKSFARGLNPIFMEENPSPKHDWQRRIWLALGQTRRYAQRMDLSKAIPRNDVASSGYALVHTGETYLVYKPDGGEITINLTEAKGVRFHVEWFDVNSEKTITDKPMDGGNLVSLTPPFTGHAVLFLSKQ